MSFEQAEERVVEDAAASGPPSPPPEAPVPPDTPPPGEGGAALSPEMIASLPLFTMWADDGGAQVERTSAPMRPSGHVLPEPPGDKNYTPEGRQEVWAEILGTESYTLRDVQDYLAARQAEKLHDAADEKQREDETLGIWPDGGIRTHREQRELGLRQYAQRSLDVLTGGPAGNLGFGLSSLFGADPETALGIGEMAQTAGSFFPFGRGGKSRGQASRPKGKGGRVSFPSRGPRVPAHRRTAQKNAAQPAKSDRQTGTETQRGQLVSEPNKAPVSPQQIASTGVVHAGKLQRTETLTGNRASRVVRALEAKMKANGWEGAPVDVIEIRGQLYVLDGHHRMEAAKRAGLAVPYRVVKLPFRGMKTPEDVLISSSEASSNRIR